MRHPAVGEPPPFGAFVMHEAGRVDVFDPRRRRVVYGGVARFVAERPADHAGEVAVTPHEALGAFEDRSLVTGVVGE